MEGEHNKNGGRTTPIIPISFVANKSAFESPLSTRTSAKRTKLKIVEAHEAVTIPSPINVLIFAKESGGKTHLGLTFPEPICVIDTEKRYHLILKKFRTCNDCGNEWCTTDPLKAEVTPKFNAPSVGPSQIPKKYVGGKKCPKCESVNIRFKNIKGITCNTSDEAIEAMNIFFEILSEEFEKTGKVGTILVDSITKNWEWCKNEYSVKKYGAAPDQGTKLNPRDDYAFINPKHNERFRDKLLTSPWNIVLTATLKNLYAQENQFEIVGVAPEGQKFNPYAVDIRIHNEQGTRTLNDGTILGDGNFKSSITKNSILEGNLDPIPFLDYKKLIKVREKLEDMACMNDIPEPTTEPKIEPKITEDN